MKGRFVPKNPQKYAGNPNNIQLRSSWEFRVAKLFDLNPSVKRWASEELSIPYVKPTDGKIHRYFPDFIVIYETKERSAQEGDPRDQAPKGGLAHHRED